MKKDSIALDEGGQPIIIHGMENPPSEKDLKKAAKKLVRIFIDIYMQLPSDQAALCMQDEMKTLQELEQFYKTKPMVTNKLCVGREKINKLYLSTKGKIDQAVIPLYQKLADRGFPKAQLNLGLIYYYGWCVAKDPERALGLFKSAAEKGFARAYFALANYYDQNADTALTECYLLLAVESGVPEAQTQLAMRYKMGIEVPQDEKKALELFQLAVEQNERKAQCELACYYLHGILVEKDEEKALALLNASAQQGYPAAQHRLATCLRQHNNPEENPKIVLLLQSAVAQRYIPAFHDLGICYLQGTLGVGRDPQKAVGFCALLLIRTTWTLSIV